MTSIPRLSIERRAESHQERRYRHGDKSPKTFRFAGEVFNTEPKEKRRSLQKAERQRLQASRPVGLGFGERDNYGPDENWDTKDPIEHKPVPDYYKV